MHKHNAEKLLPFMTAVGGHVLIHDPHSGNPLADDWVGVCVESRNDKEHWLIGRDGGERSYFLLRGQDRSGALELGARMRPVQPSEGRMTWEESVLANLEFRGGMDTSDAQAVFEAKANFIEHAWSEGLQSEEVAGRILTESQPDRPRPLGG